jgi:hypothetical protein
VEKEKNEKTKTQEKTEQKMSTTVIYIAKHILKYSALTPTCSMYHSRTIIALVLFLISLLQFDRRIAFLMTHPRKKLVALLTASILLMLIQLNRKLNRVDQ